jgi:hypothetical protein
VGPGNIGTTTLLSHLLKLNEIYNNIPQIIEEGNGQVFLEFDNEDAKY